jgi:hypothetical protein
MTELLGDKLRRISIGIQDEHQYSEKKTQCEKILNNKIHLFYDRFIANAKYGRRSIKIHISEVFTYEEWSYLGNFLPMVIDGIAVEDCNPCLELSW